MAATNTGAKFKYNMAGRTSGILYTRIIGDTKTITIGDFVKLSSGFIDLAGANSFILGVVQGIVDKDGVNMDKTNQSHSGTWTSSTHTLLTAGNNTTVDQLKAIVDIDPFSVWSVEPDSTIGGTTGSNLPGYFIDLPASSDQSDENTAAATIMQLHLWGVDPEDSTRHLVNIAEPQYLGTAD